jgi:hypothetical protein
MPDFLAAVLAILTQYFLTGSALASGGIVSYRLLRRLLKD